jgi:NADH:ubiquinone oxidoreductase subunit K
MLLINYLMLAFFIYILGLVGIFITRKNIILILISIELMLVAINFSLVVFSIYFDDMLGQIFSLFVLTVAAAESSIGLAILVIYYRLRGNVSMDFIQTIKS